MKLATCLIENQEHVCEVVSAEGRVWPLTSVVQMQDAIGRTPADLKREGMSYLLKDVVLCAPIRRPLRNILCVGKNYHDHAHEFSRSGYDAAGKSQSAVPTDPIVFTKPPQSVIAAEEAIRYPAA